MKSVPLLPTGQQDFAEIRQKKQVYVDKTAFIYRILSTKQVFFFLSRPRRFGKSLLVNTFKELFLGRKELFEGLYIYDKIAWEAYPVLHFDFSNLGFREIGLRPAIDRRLEELACSYQVNLSSEAIGLKFAELMRKLHEQTGKQVVILIDEYDKPITDVLEVGKNEKSLEHRELLRSFYGVVKGSSAHIHFFFLTGIARFAKVSLFSDLNNLTDLTFYDDFHNFLGYTQEELESYFDAHLEAVCQRQNIAKKDLLAQIRLWYNGYSWNGQARVYNPYSILRFLENKRFMNFWFDSGTPRFLIELLKNEFIYDISNTIAQHADTDNFDIEQLGLVSLLFQTGYLTIKSIDEFGSYVLSYPNKEVEESMLQYIMKGFSEKAESSSIAIGLARAIRDNDFVLLQRTIDSLFASIPYQLFDQHQEKYFHAILFLAFKLCGFHVQAEVSVASGRLDALMIYQNRVYIFEFKLNDSAENALKQIHERRYYASYQGEYAEIYLLGIGFSSQSKAVSDFKMEKLA
jgi:hypothetical protein